MSEHPPTSPSWLPVAVAVAAPFALCLAWWEAVKTLSPEEGEDGVELRGTDTAPIEGAPEVVVIGNSLSQRGIDAALLGRLLGVGQRVEVVAYPGSWAPMWYAALENRVFLHGQRPKLVVVVGTLDFVLRTDAPEGKRRADLIALMVDEEPVLESKVFGNRSIDGPLATVMLRRGLVGEAVLTAAKGAPYRFQGAEDPVAAAAADLDEVFARDGATDARAPTRAIPVAEAAVNQVVETAAPDDSLVPDLVDLATANGSRIVFATIPVSRVGAVDHPPPPLDVEREFVALLNARGAGFVDLDSVYVPDSAYLDAYHLNAAGRRLYTEALAEGILRVGALDDGPMQPAGMPRAPPEVTRTGVRSTAEVLDPLDVRDCRVSLPYRPWSAVSDARMEGLGFGPVSPVVVLEDDRPLRMHLRPDPEAMVCDGSAWHGHRGLWAWSEGDPWKHVYRAQLSDDLPLITEGADVRPAWWVYPGTTLEFTFEEDAAAGPTDVSAIVAVLGEGSLPTVEVDGVRASSELTGLRLHGTASVAGRPTTVRVTSPMDGAWGLLRGLSLTADDATEYVVGNAGDFDAGVRWLGGGDQQVTVTVDTPVPAVPHEQAQEGRPGWPWRMTVHQADVVSADALSLRSDVEHADPDDPRHIGSGAVRACWPVRATEQGVVLRPSVTTTAFREARRGTQRHREDGLWFFPINPEAKPSDFQAILLSERVCRGMVWVYPGDVVTVEDSGLGGHLLAGADRLQTTGLVFGDAEGHEVRVLVESDAGVHFDGWVPIARMDRPTAFRMRPPVPPTPRDLRVTFASEVDGPFLLVDQAVFTLSER